MQLLIILALLLYGGKSGAGNILKEVKPVLENIGGEEVQEALKSAEEISQMLEAVKELSSVPAAQGFAAKDDKSASETFAKEPAIAFPLEPVSKIADRDITYSLSQYFSRN